ncbi:MULTISPECIES: hypothetical protein [unclassified Nonomuraea]|uniref:hypothetical protein n=1 Tax=unclassified Nonomuraea TaxID=2593643 RepID=UPI0033CDF0BE
MSHPLGVSRPDLDVTDLPTPEEMFKVSRVGPKELVPPGWKLWVPLSVLVVIFAFIAGGWAASAGQGVYALIHSTQLGIFEAMVRVTTDAAHATSPRLRGLIEGDPPAPGRGTT